jgi:purine-nucleoside phosphorylase
MNKEKLFKFCFGCAPSAFTETAVVTPVFPLTLFKKFGEVVKEFKGRVYSGVILSKDGKNITVIYCGVGDRLMGDAILLLKKTPVKKIFFLGSCGGLKNSSIGDVVLCEKAFNGEGFSKYWAENFKMNAVFDSGELIPADSRYVQRIKKFISKKIENKAIIKEGKIFTIGSLLAEERGNLIALEEKGFIGIDLELSAVYSAARIINRKAMGLLVVSDLPLKKPLGESLTYQEKESYRESLNQAARFLVEYSLTY